MQHLVGKRLVGVGQEQIGEGIVDRRLVVRLLERPLPGDGGASAMATKLASGRKAIMVLPS
jgi:hypothetical protein